MNIKLLNKIWNIASNPATKTSLSREHPGAGIETWFQHLYLDALVKTDLTQNKKRQFVFKAITATLHVIAA